LGKVLDWIDLIFESIVTAIPVGEALAEFKDAQEKAIKVVAGSPTNPETASIL
jgi:hypothetical protein